VHGRRTRALEVSVQCRSVAQIAVLYLRSRWIGLEAGADGGVPGTTDATARSDTRHTRVRRRLRC